MPENLGDDRISTEGIAYIRREDAQRLSRYLVRPGDIVYSRRGDVTKRAVVGKQHDGWLCGTGCLRVRFGNDQVTPRYAFYYLGHPLVKDWISRHAIGATLPNLNTSILSALPFLLPPRREQAAIAEVLGTLDDKIELNRRMNETLEAMARAIFKSWFIDFDPVRAKAEGRQPFGMDAATAALFPDSFQDSPLGKIPKGWTVSRVGEVCEFAYGKALKEGNRRSGNVPVYGSNDQVGWHDAAVVSGPGVVVGRKGNPGVVTWVSGDFFPIDTTFYVVVKRPISSMRYLFHALEMADLPSLGADSAVPGLNRNMAYMTEMIVPPASAVKSFDQAVEPLLSRAEANRTECRTLAAIRDALLPKLISGEIRVNA